MTNLDPEVWGPHYWFFIHTIAMTYPLSPNAVTKKKYYDFIQNIPLFIPTENMAGHFTRLLDEYPVEPYLTNRESLIKWVWFVHNKINEKLEKPKISLNEFYVKYYEEYKSKKEKITDMFKWKGKLVYLGIFLTIGGSIFYLYDK
jgi:hypothetical protein